MIRKNGYHTSLFQITNFSLNSYYIEWVFNSGTTRFSSYHTWPFFFYIQRSTFPVFQLDTQAVFPVQNFFQKRSICYELS